MLLHGKHFLIMKIHSLTISFQSGTSLRSRTAPHAQEMFDKVVKLSETHPKSPGLSPYEIMVGYEFMPLKKVASVPPEATAFRARGHQPNIIQVISWDKQDGDDTGVDNARVITQELIKVVDSAAEPQPMGAINDGYINYRMCKRHLYCAIESNPRICQILTCP
jgi:hypothetical protein